MAKKQSETAVPQQQKFMQPGASIATTAKPIDAISDGYACADMPLDRGENFLFSGYSGGKKIQADME